MSTLVHLWGIGALISLALYGGGLHWIASRGARPRFSIGTRSGERRALGPLGATIAVLLLAAFWPISMPIIVLGTSLDGDL